MRRAGLPLALACAFPFSPAFGQATATLAETVVTATRAAMRADELVSDVTVIGRGAIEASTARTLPELLARTPGVQVSANGGRGKLSAVFVRGAEARHTLLLVDGVRVGSATAGTPIWENIPLEMIERIEVLKGPASALYGSDAAGGVIQVFTKKGRTGFHPRAALVAGSHGHAAASAGASGGGGGWTYAFGVQHLQEQGFNATQPYVPFGQYNPDRDGFRQHAVDGSVRYEFNRDWSADAGVLYSGGLTHFDDSPGRDSRSTLRTLAAHAGVKGRVTPGWQTQLAASQGSDTNNNIEAAFPGAFRTRETQWQWQNDVQTPLGVALAGVEQRVQKVESDTAFTVTRRTIDSAFAGLNGSAGRHSWQANVRSDRNSQFGHADTWFAGYGLRLAEHWRASVSRGTSFVAPSFNQLYYPGFSNPALQPERGRNTDFGLTFASGVHEARLVRFDNRLRGFITSTTIPANIPRARIDGWTLSYGARLDAVNLNASIDAMDPRNEVTGAQLPRRAKQQATMGADWKRGPWTFAGSLLHVGRRFDDTANTTPMGAFTTADVSATWAFARDLSLQLKVNNLADKRYETAYGYNQPGRELYVTLRWAPPK